MVLPWGLTVRVVDPVDPVVPAALVVVPAVVLVDPAVLEAPADLVVLEAPADLVDPVVHPAAVWAVLLPRMITLII